MNKFTVENEHFQGPLDALLSLIEERKLSVSQVSLAEVCDGYLAYVENLPELPLGETAQFILVASTLLLIKSRTLLPTVELSEEESLSIDELERRLARYSTIRKAARLLRREWGIKQLLFSKRAPAPEYTGGRGVVFHAGETSLATLAAAIQRVVATFPKVEKRDEATVAPVLALEEVIVNVRNRLTSSLRTRWSELTQKAGKHEAIVHFLAILELVRSGSISASQEKLFSDILLESEVLGAPRY